MNKIREILNKMPISSLLSQTEEEIFQVIDKLLPNKKREYWFGEFKDGFNYAIKVMELKIAKLKED